MEFFYGKQALAAHVTQYPSLKEGWSQLWLLLQTYGWQSSEGEGLVRQRQGQGQACYFHSPSIEQFSGPNDIAEIQRGGPAQLMKTCASSSLRMGRHGFVSSDELRAYVTRVPHLLLDDQELIEVLKEHGWVAKGTDTRTNRQLFSWKGHPLEHSGSSDELSADHW